MINGYKYFLASNFVGVNRLLVLVDINQDVNFKRFKTRRYYLPKGIIKKYNVIINGKSFYDQAIDLDIKRYEGEDYTTGCLLDYDCIKNHIASTNRTCWAIKIN